MDFRPGPVTIATAALLVLVFALEVALSDALTGPLAPTIQVLVAFGAISKDFVLQQHEWWRLVASPLLHADVVHLVLNGVVLLFAGFSVEAMVGKARWLALYGVGALVGGLFSAFFNPPTLVSVGASGAGMALLAALFVLAFSLEDPARRQALQLSAARFLVPSLLPMATSRAGEHVDFAAHFGGALGGALVAFVLLWELKRRAPEAQAMPGPVAASEPASPSQPLTPLVVPLAALLVAVTAAGIAFTARDAPGLLVLQARAKAAEWIPWLRQACAWRSRVSCVVLGRALATGDGVEKDSDAARPLLAPACAARDVDACFALGQLEYDARNFEPAAAAWNVSCALGELAACRNQAFALEALGRPEDTPTIRALFRQACPDVPASCADFARLAWEDEPQAAATAARQACDGKDGFGCWLSGSFHADGTGVEKNEARAREFHQEACDLGDVRGCNSLALLVQDGRGGPVDLPRAAGLFEKACATGDALSCANFAISLWKGKGVEKDAPRALKLFEYACAAGVSFGCDGVAELVPSKERLTKQAVFEQACAANAASGCLYLGAIFEYREDVDFAAADANYLKACQLGDAYGCAWHADLLDAGKGVAKDPEAAGDFYARACQLGLKEACGK
jgi:membrane associated rhomboid family serine protease/TPR repeat protein